VCRLKPLADLGDLLLERGVPLLELLHLNIVEAELTSVGQDRRD
jgi:hypothetical protein